MSEAVRWIAAGAGAGLFLLVIELVRRRLVAEEYSFPWLLGAGALLVPALWPAGTRALAHRLGLSGAAALVLVVVAVAALGAALFLTVVVSRQRRQIERLVEDVAILSAELRERPAPPEPGRRDPS